MDVNQIKQVIGQIEKSIDQIEPSLNSEDFNDYCDNAYTLVAYWRKQIRIINNTDNE